MMLSGIIFLFLILTVSGGSYVHPSDRYSIQDPGFFNSVKEINRYEKTLSTTDTMPLYYDFDGDNVTELITRSGNNINIYQGNKLTFKGSLATTCTISNSYSNGVIYDIDNDSVKEYIIACDKKVVMFNYTGTLKLERTITIISTVKNNQSVLGCAYAHHCYLLSTKYPQGTYTTQNNVYFSAFNETHFQASVNAPLGSGVNSYTWDTPELKSMECGNFDGGTDYECVFSLYEKTNIPAYNVRVMIMNAHEIQSAPGTIKQNLAISTTSDVTYRGTKHLSPVTMFYDSILGLYEPLVAYNTDADEYRIGRYDTTLTEIAHYPSTTYADGNIISNVFIGDYFENGFTNYSFCVLGVRNTESEIDMLCGSPDTAYGFTAYEFKNTFSGMGYNLTEVNRSFFIHSSQQSYNVTTNTATDENPTNKHEVLTPFGVYTPVWRIHSYDGLIPIYSLEKIYSSPVSTPNYLLSYDLGNDGHAELIAQEPTLLTSIDDKFVNSPGIIKGDINFNPCLETVWKANTSVTVSYRVYDADSDQVCAQAYIYYGTTKSQDSGVLCGSSNQLMTFSFIANVTGSNYRIVLSGWDVSHSTGKSYYNTTFSVSANGVEYDECKTTISGYNEATTSTGNTTLSQTPATDNVFKQAMIQIDSNLGIGSTVIWVILMMLISGVIIWMFVRYSTVDPAPVAFIVACFNAMMLVLGTMLGFIPFGIFIAFVIFFLVIGVVFLWSKLTGASGA